MFVRLLNAIPVLGIASLLLVGSIHTWIDHTSLQGRVISLFFLFVGIHLMFLGVKFMKESWE